jgi:hypothetical protein
MALTLDHSRILKFFEAHPNLDPEDTICKMIDVMETLNEFMSNTMSNTAVLDMLNRLNHKMDDVCRLNSDTHRHFAEQMGTLKKEYIEELRMVLTCNVSDKIEPLLREQNAALFEKTNAMISSLIPKNEAAVVGRIEAVVKDFQDNVTADTKQLLSNTMGPATLHQYLAEFDGRIQHAISNSQTILSSSIENTERRMENRMATITDTSNKVSEALHTSVNTLLHKFDNSSSKGQLSENLLYNVLSELYPMASIEHVGQTKETGDIMLRRTDHPTILVENKDWSRPVPHAEVIKFIRDVETQKCSGVFLSQNGSITSKNNFEIDVCEGHVMVYVHKVCNDPERIKMAVDIVDHLSPTLVELSSIKEGGGDEMISKELLKRLNSDFNTFTESKLAVINNVKAFQKTLLKQLDEIKMPALDDYLRSKLSKTAPVVYKCDYCDYTHPTKQGRGAHMRGCPVLKSKKQAATQITI